MKSFFNGWRRKVGIMTLLSALVMMIGWVRSDLSEDWVSINSRRIRTRLLASSANGRINVLRWMPHETGPSFSWGARAASKDRNPLTNRGVKKPFDLWNEFNVENRFDWAGFHFGAGRHRSWNGVKRIEIWFIPYWSIVVPMTAVSAFFLLSKPRPLAQQKFPSPLQMARPESWVSFSTS
jgi:hypothetical protein